MSEPWRSLDELAQTPEFLAAAEREFPGYANVYEGEAEPWAGFDRRRFLQLMAASIGLAGATGCRRPDFEIRPYSKKPDEVVHGLATFYATSLPRPGGCFPVIVESREGRPVKIEGNPRHPFSQGKSDIHAQAALLDLYDPSRSRRVLKDGQASDWAAFDGWAKTFADGLKASRGRGAHFVVDAVPSPAARMLREYCRSIAPEAVWHADRPRLLPAAKLETADVILSIDCDFLGLDPACVPNMRAFAARRRDATMNRLYVVETALSVTGSNADHRLALPTHLLGVFLDRLRSKLSPNEEKHTETGDNPIPDRWLNAVAADLKTGARRRAVVLVGARLPAWVHDLAAQLNDSFSNAVESCPDLDADWQPLAKLGEASRTGNLQSLIVLGVNPVFTNGATFAALLAKTPMTLHLGSHADETAEKCRWHLPMSHSLESWGDGETVHGQYVAQQPLIAPLFGGRSVLETAARLTGFAVIDGYEITRRSFTRAAGTAAPIDFQRALHEGLWTAANRPTSDRPPQKGLEALRAETAEGIELSFHADPKLIDGRHASNGWLQELPDPITKLTWDNAALIAPAMAKRLGITTGDVLKLSAGQRSVEIAAFVQPGQADNSISLHRGYGRSKAGHLGSGRGVDVGILVPDDAAFVTGATVEKTGRRYSLATTQDHNTLNGRDLVRTDLGHDQHHHGTPPQPEQRRDEHGRVPLNLATQATFTEPHQWGMTIDLAACTGCSACVVACQSENNSPIVGKDEILRFHDMHWLRIDRYYQGEADQLESVAHQPLMCVQCEAAPCEPVCPVNASVHSPEGLNLQVYNRCVGTRYCANNCPYKARKFNWSDYTTNTLYTSNDPFDGHTAPNPVDGQYVPQIFQQQSSELLKMVKNPDVSVRMRGVMEKCTYCVQRIEAGKLGVKLQNPGSAGPHLVPDGTVQTACAQACPASAITFGNLADPNSRVSQLKREQRNYRLLDELNTRARTSYLAGRRNPNPALADAEGHG